MTCKYGIIFDKRMDILERVQNRTMKVSVEMNGLNSEDKLSLLGLSSRDDM